jgi:hypothetical protein
MLMHGWAERAPARKPTFSDLDSELSSFLSDDSPPRRAPLLIEPEPDDTNEDLIDEIEEANNDRVQFFESVRPAARAEAGKTLVDVVPSGADPSPRSEELSLRAHEPSQRQERAPSLKPMPRSSLIPSEIPRPPRSPALIWGGALLVLSLGIVIATVQLRPDLIGRLTHSDPEPLPKQPVVVIKRPAAGDLVVRVSTERAQILRFVGRGPFGLEQLGDERVGRRIPGTRRDAVRVEAVIARARVRAGKMSAHVGVAHQRAWIVGRAFAGRRFRRAAPQRGATQQSERDGGSDHILHGGTPGFGSRTYRQIRNRMRFRTDVHARPFPRIHR